MNSYVVFRVSRTSRSFGVFALFGAGHGTRRALSFSILGERDATSGVDAVAFSSQGFLSWEAPRGRRAGGRGVVLGDFRDWSG